MSQNFPRLNDVFEFHSNKTASAAPDAGENKTAGTVPDPGPDSGHPASADPDNIPVPEGATLSEEEKKSKEHREKLAVENQEGATQDKGAVTMETTTGKDGSEFGNELDYGSGIADPGADPNHPASTPSEKYASCETAEDVAAVMQEAITQISSKIAEMQDPDYTETSAQEPQEVSQGGPQDGSGVVEPKAAQILSELIPDGEDENGVSYAQKYAEFVGSNLEPYVAEAVRRAENFATYCKVAMQDPAQAEAMYEGEMPLPPPGAEAEGGMPMPPGPGPGAGPAPPAAGGGEIAPEDLEQAIMEIAQELGMSPEEVIEQLMAEIGPPAEAGPPPAASAGPEVAPEPPPEPAQEPPAEPSEEPPASAEEEKTASAAAKEGSEKTAGLEDDSVKKQAGQENIRKLAKALLSEVGKTPKQVAQGVC